MTIQFRCSQCGATETFPDDCAGKTVTCAQCGRKAYVPEGSAASSPRMSDNADPPRIARSPRDWLTVVVIAVCVVIVMALFMPALNGIRNRGGRRADCVNNLSQLVKAAINFEGRHGRFPGSQELLLEMDPATVPPDEPGHNKPASWAVVLLEDLGRADLMERWNSAVVGADDPASAPVLNYMRCPSSSAPMESNAVTSYVANAGFMPRSWTDPPPFDDYPSALLASQNSTNGVFLSRIRESWMPADWQPPSVRSADLRDGESNTILFSENLAAASWCSFGPLDPLATTFRVNQGWSTDVIFPAVRNARFGNTFVWCYAHETNGPALDLGRPEPQIPPEPRMKINGEKRTYYVADKLGAEVARPSSGHPGGANVAFADGRVVFLSDEIAYHVYQQLMTPHGAKSDMPSRSSYVLRDSDYGGD